VCGGQKNFRVVATTDTDQTYMVDMVSRAIDYRLKVLRIKATFFATKHGCIFVNQMMMIRMRLFFIPLFMAAPGI
jgi:hypothetical protein